MTSPHETIPQWVAKLCSMARLPADALAFWRQAQEMRPELRYAFMTPTYCQAVEAVQAGQVWVMLAYRDEQLVAMLPVQRPPTKLRWFGVWEPVGGAMCDYFGFIYQDPNLRLDAARLLRGAGMGAVYFSHLDETQLSLGLSGEEPRIGLRTALSGEGALDWERLRNLDKKLVADTERRERKLVAEHGALTFELQSSMPDADLAELIVMKRAQYERTGKLDAVLFSRANLNLLKRLLKSENPECSALLSVLRIDGKLVAAHFGLLSGGLLHFWFPVYAEDYSNYSPGRILFKYVMVEGRAAGISAIDRGEGDTRAKREVATHEHVFYKGVWCGGSVLGLIARLALSVSWRRNWSSESVRELNAEASRISNELPQAADLSMRPRKYTELPEDTVTFWRQAKGELVPTLNPYLTHGFARACHDIGLDVRVIEFYQDGKLMGLFPCQYTTLLDRMLGVVDRVGGSMSDLMGAIPTRMAGETYLLHCPGVNAIRYDHFLLRTFKFDEEIGQSSEQLRIGWMLELDVDFDSYYEQRLGVAKKRLQNLENRKRKIGKDFGPLRLETKAHPSVQEVNRVVLLKSEQYRMSKVRDVFANRKNVELLEQLSRNADPSATLLLSDLYAGDKLIASHLGLQNGEILNYWFPVYDTNYKEYSPGLIMLSELIREMRGYGLRYLDFGEGDSEYKRVFANAKYWNSKRFIANEKLSGKVAQYSESLRWRINKYVND